MSQRAHSSYSHERAFDGMNILTAVFFPNINRALFVKRLVLDATLPRRLHIVGGGAYSKDVLWR